MPPLLGKARIIDDPSFDLSVPFNARQHYLTNLGQHLLIRPVALTDKMQQRLMLRCCPLRSRHRRHRLDTLPIARHHQPSAVIAKRFGPSRMSDHACKTINICRKPRRYVSRFCQTHLSLPMLKSESSQLYDSCRQTLRHSDSVRLVRGYNTVEGRRVFSGMHILGAAAGHINLRSVPGPESGAGVIPTFDNPEVRGVNEEPLAISHIIEQVNDLGQIAPRMIFVNTTTDYFSLRASLGRTGGSGTEDKPLPPNVRMYDIAGASHALIPGTSQCKLPYAILDWHPVLRSTLVALDRWVSANISPPPNELMPLREAPDV